MRKRNLLYAVGALAILSGPAYAAPSYLLSYEFQNNMSVGGSGEIATNAAAGPNGTGGMLVYDKVLPLAGGPTGAPFVALFIKFSAQADVHNRSALLMNATVNGNLVEPLAGQTAGGGGGPFIQTGWWTLLHPTTGVEGACGDGGGGSSDCHDNSISFSGCYVLSPNDPRKDARVQINLADLPGNGINLAFYERASIEIDGTLTNGDRNLCHGVGTETH